jgi:hypothetical protein
VIFNFDKHDEGEKVHRNHISKMTAQQVKRRMPVPNKSVERHSKFRP